MPGTCGGSGNAEPPQESRKKATARSSAQRSKERIASAARQLSAFGLGWPATKYSRPGIVDAGFVGAATTPRNCQVSGRNERKPAAIAWAAFPMATTNVVEKTERSIAASSSVSTE